MIDTTGSMGDELEYIKAEVRSIARAVHNRFPQVDQRFALVVYRDEGDEYVTRRFDFAGLEEFRSDLRAQSAGGGGDRPVEIIAPPASTKASSRSKLVFSSAVQPNTLPPSASGSILNPSVPNGRFSMVMRIY